MCKKNKWKKEVVDIDAKPISQGQLDAAVAAAKKQGLGIPFMYRYKDKWYKLVDGDYVLIEDEKDE